MTRMHQVINQVIAKLKIISLLIFVMFLALSSVFSNINILALENTGFEFQNISLNCSQYTAIATETYDCIYIFRTTFNKTAQLTAHFIVENVKSTDNKFFTGQVKTITQCGIDVPGFGGNNNSNEASYYSDSCNGLFFRNVSPGKNFRIPKPGADLNFLDKVSIKNEIGISIVGDELAGIAYADKTVSKGGVIQDLRSTMTNNGTVCTTQKFFDEEGNQIEGAVSDDTYKNARFRVFSCGLNGRVFMLDNKNGSSIQLDESFDQVTSVSATNVLALQNATATGNSLTDISGSNELQNAYRQLAKNTTSDVEAKIKSKVPEVKCDEGILNAKSQTQANIEAIYSCYTTETTGQPPVEKKTYYDLDGNKLDATQNCNGFSLALSGDKNNAKIDTSTMKNKCIKDTELTKLKALSINTNASNNVTAEAPNSGFSKIQAALFNIVAAVLLILVYFLASVASVIMSVLGVIFITLLSINPADPKYFNAAYQPWLVLIGLANLVTLSTFIIVGLGYILNLESFKVKIQQFILNIAIFSLLLNLTLSGSALFVNLSNGVGDVLIAAYAGVEDGRPNKSGLINFLSNSMNTISLVRCGKWTGTSYVLKDDDNCKTDGVINPLSATENVLSGGGDLKNIGSAVGGTIAGGELGSFSSRPIQLFIMETVFLLTVLYGIFLMFRGVTYVMFRVVGLWLLMVVSPLALGLYFSPLKTLKKYGSDWLDKFWRLCLAYPALVLGLIIVSRLVRGFGEAVKSNFADANKSEGDQEKLIILFISACLVALISIGAFSLLLTFMEVVFGALAKALLDGVKKGVGSLSSAWKGIRRVAGIAATASRITGKVVTSPIGLVGNTIASFGKLTEKAFGETAFSRGAKGAGAAFKNLGSGISNTLFAVPDVIASSLSIPGKMWKNVVKGREIEKARTDIFVDGAFEAATRSLGIYNGLGLGKTGDFKSFPMGMGKDGMGGAWKKINSIADNKTRSLTDQTNYLNSDLEWQADNLDKLDLSTTGGQKILESILKNQVLATQVLEDDKIKGYLKKNLDSLPSDLLEKLRKEYPISDLFANGKQGALAAINSMSTDDAKKVNIQALARIDNTAYQEFIKRFPDYLSKMGDGIDNNAGSRATQIQSSQIRDRLANSRDPNNQRYSEIDVETIVRASWSTAVTKPNFNSYEQYAASVATTAAATGASEDVIEYLDDQNNLQTVTYGSNPELYLAKKVYNNMAQAIYGNSTVNNLAAENLRVSDFTKVNADTFFQNRLDKFGDVESALSDITSTTVFGKKLVQDNPDFVEAVTKAQAASTNEEAAKFNDIAWEIARGSLATSIEAAKVQQLTLGKRLEKDIPIQIGLKAKADSNNVALKEARDLSEKLVTEVSIDFMDPRLVPSLPSAQKKDEFEEAVRDGTMDQFGAVISAQGVVNFANRKWNYGEKGISDRDAHTFNTLLAQHTATVAKREALYKEQGKPANASRSADYDTAIIEMDRQITARERDIANLGEDVVERFNELKKTVFDPDSLYQAAVKQGQQKLRTVARSMDPVSAASSLNSELASKVEANTKRTIKNNDTGTLKADNVSV